jgi:hypothetical protein
MNRSIALFWIPLLASAACGHPTAEQPMASACLTDSIWVTTDSDFVRALKGKFTLRLVTARASPRQLATLEAVLALDKGDRYELLGGVASIPQEPFAGIRLPMAPSEEDGIRVALERGNVVRIIIGGANDWPNFSLTPTVYGKHGFAGRWFLQWLPEGGGKDRRAFGTFCAHRPQ